MPTDMTETWADMVDGEFWIETPASLSVMAQLFALLELSRDEPRPWLPRFVLAGPSGVGKTALAARFARAARRNIACRLADIEFEATGTPRRSRRDEDDRIARAREAARNFGACPGHCAPAAFLPTNYFEFPTRPKEGDVRHLLHGVHVDGETVERSHGNQGRHPLRRTTLVFCDGADHLLNIGDTRRKAVLDDMSGPRNRQFVQVLVGSPRLAEVVQALGPTQVIRLTAMEEDATFARVVHMIFGPCSPEEVRRLHRSSGGAMGPLLHIARMRGLAPPFAVAPDDVRRLPTPA